MASALQFSEQSMAGFIVLLTAGGLLFFVLLGLAEVMSLGLGFAFGYWGTEPGGASAHHRRLRRHQHSLHWCDAAARMYIR